MSPLKGQFQYDLIVSLVLYKPHLEHLQQTLSSLLQSHSLRIKVTIVDNSPQALNLNLFNDFGNLEYFHSQKNLGYGKAHNINIAKYAHEARFFLVLNPDVYFEPSLLRDLVLRMENDSNIGLCIPRICHPSGKTQLVNRRLPRPQDYVISFLNTKFKKQIFTSENYKKYLLRDLDITKPFKCPTISGCFMLFQSEVLRQVGGFDKRYFLYLEDTDLSRRVAQKTDAVVFSDLVAYHHWNRGAYKSAKLFFIFARNLVRYFNKWGWLNDNTRQSLNSSVKYYSVQPETSKNSILKNPDLFDSL